MDTRRYINSTHNENCKQVIIETNDPAALMRAFFSDADEAPFEEVSCSIPSELDTSEAQRLWAIAKEHEWVDDDLMPLISQKKAAILASVMADKLQLKPRWAAFEKFWRIADMANKLSQAQNCLYYADTLKQMDKALN